MSTPAENVSLPKVTSSGTIEMPSEAALAGSMSDAEAVITATRLMVRPSHCAAQPGCGGDPSPPRQPGGARRAARLGRDGALLEVSAGRHVHAPVQHRPDRCDARDVPRPFQGVPPGGRRGLRDPGRRLRGQLLPGGAAPLADLRLPLPPPPPPP